MLEKLLATKQMTLIVSLAENKLELAQAALAGGADALKVHANVSHRASGNTFTSVQEQQELFFKIIQLAGSVPVGLVPGDSPDKITDKEIRLAEELGFNFLSIYAHHIPVKEVQDSRLIKVVSFDCSYRLDDQVNYDQLEIDLIEASIMNQGDYGKRLTYRDLIDYSSLINKVKKPVVIPTQKAIQPAEVRLLSKTGAKAVMIGAIVTGKNVDSVNKMTSLFKEQITKGGFN